MFSQRIRTRPLISLFLFFFLLSGALAQEKSCTLHDNGKYYDLNPLKAREDYELQTPSGEKIQLNVCQNVKTELHGIKDDSINEGDVAAFIRRGHGDFILGKVNTTLSVFDSKPRFVISGGSRCKSGEIRASTMVQFVCDVSFGSSGPRLLAQLPPGDDESACAYVIEWRTPYACPTSEGSGFWRFITILAIIFLVVLMTYTVLGTLYNRFVLQLRGFDQIPQFSIESMKYHGSEAWDWIKDMWASLNITEHTPGGGNSYGGLPSNGGRTPNPVSHQAQVSGFGVGDNAEEGIPFNGGGGGFIRPQVGKNRSTSFTKPETNPVSHQSQVLEAQSLSYSSPSPRSSQSPPQVAHNNIPQTRRTILETRGPTKEERGFMLGEDDDDAQELVDVKPPPIPSIEGPAFSTSPQSAPSANSPPVNVSSSSSLEPVSAAAAERGRDLGGGGTIRL